MASSASPWAVRGLRCCWTLGALLLLGVSGCRKGEPTVAADGGRAPQVRRYTVRGEVVRLPDPASHDSEVLVRHEAIDDFVNSSGEVVGMASMVMPFPIDPPSVRKGLAVGDKVEIRFSVDWSQSAFRVERVEKLPPPTPLRFGPARPRSP